MLSVMNRAGSNLLCDNIMETATSPLDETILPIVLPKNAICIKPTRSKRLTHSEMISYRLLPE
jgi:hypothetical protein